MIKAMKDIACEEWGWVAERVVGFCNLDVTKVAKFGSGVSMRTLGLVVGSEEGSDNNMMTNDMYKAQSKSIYVYYYIVTSVNDSEMITQNFLLPERNHRYYPFVF